MKFSYFSSVRAQQGELCTYEKFLEASRSPLVAELCAAIAREPDHEKQQQMKKQLPIITFNACFDGQRKNELAQPSGGYMVDLDGVGDPFRFYSEHICGRKEELGIVYVGETPSRHGLRIVAGCRPEFSTIAECQQWLSDRIGCPCDPACKDWARASYVVPDTYHYYLDAKAMFQDEPAVRYEAKANAPGATATERRGPKPASDNPEAYPSWATASTIQSFRGIQLSTIAVEWLRTTGGEPVEGERNSRLFDCAKALRHITDFNEAAILDALPTYGLSDSEMRSLVHSACSSPRGSRPKELDDLLSRIAATPDGDSDIAATPTLDMPLPPLPPLFRQLARIAPRDFVVATILSLLPLLGTLASKLRARYLDKRMHSPSFQVSLEAPQASGKSFMGQLATLVLAPIAQRDQAQRQREQEYNEKAAELKMTGLKVTPENRDELLGQRPKGIIRCVPATISITKMLMRMENACGLHLIAVSEEIDTVTKAFKRAISSYSDALRVSFDNGLYGQDYASENSYSGILPLYYNTLFSGTPKAMRRFYPDVEDGLVSRVTFVQLPDQFGKPMPVWGDLTAKESAEVQRQIRRLDEVSIVGDAVQPDHVMQLDFLNRALGQWLREQQQEAVRTDNRTLDIFCRRAAVVGFRAGMLAWFLYGEKDSRSVHRNTVLFAQWVAGQMLMQHLLRFQIDGSGSNTNHWEDAYRMLPDEFTRDDLQRVVSHLGKATPMKNIVYNWRLLGTVEVVETVAASNGKHQAVRFRKKKV